MYSYTINNIVVDLYCMIFMGKWTKYSVGLHESRLGISFSHFLSTCSNYYYEIYDFKPAVHEAKSCDQKKTLS